MTHREILASEFVLSWLAICAAYGRKTYTDFRIQAARNRYLEALAEQQCECGEPVAKVQNPTLCEECRIDLFGAHRAA